MRAKPERARVSRAEKRKAARTPRLAEARASAPAGTLKLHFRKARLQDRVPKNDELTGISHKQREHQFLCSIQHPSGSQLPKEILDLFVNGTGLLEAFREESYGCFKK
jgi:hypothetical protein